MKQRALNFVAAVALLFFTLCASAQSPKYIFYFIGDGMGPGSIMSAQNYNRLVLKNDKPLLMMQFPVASMAMTYSFNSPVTDSAAAGTALATGHKTKNYMLGMGPDTIPVFSIANTLQKDGYGIGIITSVYPDDATPGAFYTHVPNRSMYYEIGIDAAKSGFDFIGGSNLRGLTKDGEPTDLMEQLEISGYSVVRGVDAVAKAKTDKIFLLSPFEDRISNIGYTIDSLPGAMTLPQMTKVCLNHLLKNKPSKFFMMVEGGNIDHAAHGNDGGAVVKEVINFNEALQIAYDFYLAHPDETLIVVTADHDTGGMALNSPASPDGIKTLMYSKMSKEIFSDECKAILKSRRVFTWDDMRDMLEANFGLWKYVKVSPEQEEILKEKFVATFELQNSDDQKTLYKSFNSFAVEVFNVINNAAGIAWTTTGHSGNPVPVFAVGVGAERFGQLNNNIEIPAKILSIVNH